MTILTELIRAIPAFFAVVSPVFADSTGADSNSPAAWVGGFGIARDLLNAGLIGVIGWAIRWFVINVGPDLKKSVIAHNELITKLGDSHERIKSELAESVEIQRANRNDLRVLLGACPKVAQSTPAAGLGTVSN